MHLHVRILRKVNYVLQSLTADYDLALYRFSRICLFRLLDLTIHGINICSHLQVGKNLDKLSEVLSDQIYYSIVCYLHSASRWFLHR